MMKKYEFNLWQVIGGLAFAMVLGAVAVHAKPRTGVSFESVDAKEARMAHIAEQRGQYLRSADGLREMIPRLKAQAINDTNDITYASLVYAEEVVMNRAERASKECSSIQNKKLTEQCIAHAINGNA